MLENLVKQQPCLEHLETRDNDQRTPLLVSLVKVPSWWRHSPPTSASWGRLSRLLAARRTRDEPPSRPGSTGRLRCGREARPKSSTLRTFFFLPTPRLVASFRASAAVCQLLQARPCNLVLVAATPRP